MRGFGGSHSKAPPPGHPLQHVEQYHHAPRFSERDDVRYPKGKLPWEINGDRAPPTLPIINPSSRRTDFNETLPSPQQANYGRRPPQKKSTLQRLEHPSRNLPIPPPSSSITDFHQFHPFPQQASYDRRSSQTTAPSQRLDRPSRNLPKLNTTSTFSSEVQPKPLRQPPGRTKSPEFQRSSKYAFAPQVSKQSSSKICAAEPRVNSSFNFTQVPQSSNPRCEAPTFQRHPLPNEDEVSPLSTPPSSPVDKSWTPSPPASPKVEFKKFSSQRSRNPPPAPPSKALPQSRPQQPKLQQPTQRIGSSGWHDDPRTFLTLQSENRKNSKNGSNKSNSKSSWFSRWKK
ncbi:hypothetical protein N431DRAFT_509492 [Stipitochalara longipes BDJ]|nr:hypothetical protein N431DRAFT_509492 [Stipitochalara longipes BDJ]